MRILHKWQRMIGLYLLQTYHIAKFAEQAINNLRISNDW